MTTGRPAGEPYGRPQLVDRQSLVFWLFAVLVGFSALHLYEYVIAGNKALVPAVAWLALVEWALYAAVFLTIVSRHQLFVRRPLPLTFAALAWGGVVALWFAIEADQMLEDIFTHAISPEWNAKWGASVAAATNEEILKALGLVVLVLLPLVRVRSALDGWYYGMMVGLGFQVVEDYAYTVGQSATTSEAIKFLFLRGLVAGLFAHAIYTGLVGFGIGYLVTRRDRRMAMRIGVAVGLFAAAWLMHFLWDSPVLVDWGQRSSGAFYASILVKGAPALVLLLVILRLGRQRERKVWTAFVEDFLDPSLVPEQDRVALLDRRGRTRARKAERARTGRAGGRIQMHLQLAQLRYVQSVMEEGADSARAEECAAEIRELLLLARPEPAPAPAPAPV